MGKTKSNQLVNTKLLRISTISAKDSKAEFRWLMPHFNLENLRQCFDSLDRNKAVGVDRLTKEGYEQNLEENLKNLIERMKQMSYRPKPAKEVLIPKSDGGKRPLGISCIEDKIVQTMFAKILESIYEPVFLGSSFGFRPGRNCHQMLRAINQYIFSSWSPTVLDIDLKNYFGSISHEKLLKLLQLKIKDKVFLRYLSRMLKAGVLTDNGIRRSNDGTSQGSVCSPILANIFGHYALDLWFKEQVKPRCGSVEIFRYCDDFVICCTNREDAKRILKALPKRLERFDLAMNHEKSKTITLNKSDFRKGIKQPTFDLLGFTFHLKETRGGYVMPAVIMSRKRINSKLKDIKNWIKWNRDKGRMPELWKGLQSRLRGIVQYFGVSNNALRLDKFIHHAIKIFFKWMNRRSQKRSFTWDQFAMFQARFPQVKARVLHKLY